MKIRTAMELGALIRSRRESLGMNQQDLAKEIGVGRQWVVLIERGKPGAAIGLLLKTLRALKLAIDVTEIGSASIATSKKHKDVIIDINAIADSYKRPRK